MKCKDGSMSCTRILNRIEDHSLECLQCFSRIDVDSSIKQKALLIRHFHRKHDMGGVRRRKSIFFVLLY